MESKKFSSGDTRVVLLSGHAGAGKDTVADYMCARYGFMKLSFAAPIYYMLAKMLNVSVSELHEMKRNGEKVPGTHVTVRHALQTLGTEWGRAHIDTNLWVKMAIRKIQLLAPERWYNDLPQRFVMTDCRFTNEYTTFQMSELSSKLVSIARDRAEGIQMEHKSERDISKLSFYAEMHLDNNGDKFQLFENVDTLVADLYAIGWLTK